jgi:hypothetical protein
MSWVRQRVDYNIEEFNRIITLKGLQLQWEKASKCPCMKIGGTGQPDFNCPLCTGKGWVWFDPLFIQGIVTAVNQNFRYDHPGELSSGTCNITTMPANKLGYYDRLSQIDSLMRHSELIKKGDHNGKDKIRFQPMEVLYCRDLNKIYVQGEDFKFDKMSFQIEWIPGGNQPNTGVTYTIDYMTHPRWICIDLMPIRDTYVKSAGAAGTATKNPHAVFTQLPVRASVRLEWFIFNIVDP